MTAHISDGFHKLYSEQDFHIFDWPLLFLDIPACNFFLFCLLLLYVIRDLHIFIIHIGQILSPLPLWAAEEEDQGIKEQKGHCIETRRIFNSRASEKFDFALESQPGALHGMFSRCWTHYTKAVSEVKALLYIQPDNFFYTSISSVKGPFPKHLNDTKTYINAKSPVKGWGSDLMLPPSHSK